MKVGETVNRSELHLAHFPLVTIVPAFSDYRVSEMLQHALQLPLGLTSFETAISFRVTGYC